MLIPKPTGHALVSETARRLTDENTPFVSFGASEPIAKVELTELFGLLNKNEAQRLVGTSNYQDTLLARALIFFARDPETEELHSVPWIKSPDDLRSASHNEIADEFRSLAGQYPDVQLDAGLNIIPDALAGVIVRGQRADAFLTYHYPGISDQHVESIAEAQEVLASQNAPLNVRIGYTLLSSEAAG